MYALTRLQADRGTWYWAVHFKRNGKLHYRRFYDPKYGDSRKSKKAAIAWRDEHLATVPVLTNPGRMWARRAKHCTPSHPLP